MARQHSNKNKTEKSKTRPDTPVNKYLIAGKLNENEWSDILDDEESEEIVSEYVSELMDHVIHEAYKIYLNRQVIPFTVHQTSEALLQMIELEFMDNDKGDCDNHTEWLKDSVPLSCKIDSWAQGAISKRCDRALLKSTNKTQPKTDAINAVISRTNETVYNYSESVELNRDTEDSNALIKKSSLTSVNLTTKKLSVKDSKKTKSTKFLEQKQPNQNVPSSTIKPRKTFTFKPHRGKLQPIPQMDESLDAKEFVKQTLRKKPEQKLKKPIAPQQRFPGSQRFAFDDEGNLVSVPRLVSTPTQVNRANKQAVLQEQPADRLGSLTNTVSVKWHVLQNPADDALQAISYCTDDNAKKELFKKSPRKGPEDINMMKRKLQVKAMASGLFSLIDLMDPMPGVTVSDGERTRMGKNVSNEHANELLDSRWNELNEVEPIRNREMPDLMIPPLLPESLVQVDAIQLCGERKTNTT